MAASVPMMHCPRKLMADTSHTPAYAAGCGRGTAGAQKAPAERQGLCVLFFIFFIVIFVCGRVQQADDGFFNSVILYLRNLY